MIVVVTKNRLRHHSKVPYSASVFRLRSMNSAQNFLQAAQQFFSKLSEATKLRKTDSIDRVAKPELRTLSSIRSFNGKSKLKTRPTTTVPPIRTTLESSRNSTPIRLITRTEFDPGRLKIQPAVEIHREQRSHSASTSSSDSQSIHSKQEILSFTKTEDIIDYNEEFKINIHPRPQNLSGDYVAELLRELKELRNEIATLKVDKKISNRLRTTSTSPLVKHHQLLKQMRDSSTTTTNFDGSPSVFEMDAQTQTDFSLISHRRRQSSRKNKKTMVGSGTMVMVTKKKTSPLPEPKIHQVISTSSATTASDQEGNIQRNYYAWKYQSQSDLDTIMDSSSQINDSSIETNETTNGHQTPTVLVTVPPPRPNVSRNLNPIINSNYSNLPYMQKNGMHNEEATVTTMIPVMVGNEMSQFLSTAKSSTSSTISTEFRENLNPVEHIYENIPTLMQTISNRGSIYGKPLVDSDDLQRTSQNGYTYSSIANNGRDNEINSLVPNGFSQPTPVEINLSSSPPSKDTPNVNQVAVDTIPTQKPQIVSMGRHRSQPVYFANHLTNPMLNMDKQLLVNTIANQFGIDFSSPQLHTLVCNQHLFVSRKRTFANMVWQMTPDEELALRSSPIESIAIDLIEEQQSSVSSILKSNKPANSTTLRRSITWDSSLE